MKQGSETEVSAVPLSGNGALVPDSGPIPGIPSESRNAWSLVLVVSIVALALRLAYIPLVELSPHEAYYWQYSRHAALSYFDHPPMCAWWIQAGTAVFGRSEFGVRFTAACGAFVTSLFLFLTARRLASPCRAAGVTVVASSLPTFAFAGVVAGPDAPLVCFASGLAWAVAEAVFGGRPRMWLAAGVAAGGAMLSKYHGIALVGSIFLFLVTSGIGRRQLRSPWPWAAAAIAAAIFTPVLVWNYQHDWVSFRFQFARRAGHSLQFEATDTLSFLLGQILMATPFFLAAIMGALKGSRPWQPHAWFGACLFAPMWFLFLALSATSDVKRHWAGPAYVGGVLLLATAHIPGWMERRRWILPSACALGFAGLAAAAVHGVTGYPMSPQATLTGWREGGRRADDLARPGEFIAGIGRRYRLSSELAFYGGDEADVWSDNVLGRMSLAYDTWDDPVDLRGRDGILVYDDSERLDRHLSDGTLDCYFTSTKELERLSVWKSGKLIRTYIFLRGTCYRPAPHE